MFKIFIRKKVHYGKVYYKAHKQYETSEED